MQRIKKPSSQNTFRAVNGKKQAVVRLSKINESVQSFGGEPSFQDTPILAANDEAWGSTDCFFLSIRKISKRNKSTLLGALRHNKRNLPHAFHIDESLSHQNYDLHSNESALEINRKINRVKREAGYVLPPVNQVLAVEVLYSLPSHWKFKENKHYFEDCYEWTREMFKVQIISFTVHLDETSPHAHALLLPMINGRMQGSDLVGGPGKLAHIRKTFHEQVAARYNLRNPYIHYPSKVSRNEKAKEVLGKLQFDPARKSNIWEWIRAKIERDPFSCARILNPES